MKTNEQSALEAANKFHLILNGSEVKSVHDSFLARTIAKAINEALAAKERECEALKESLKANQDHYETLATNLRTTLAAKECEVEALNLDHISDLQVQSALLSADIYVPGGWHCRKCQFSLTKSFIHLDGAVSCNLSGGEEFCPNDGEKLVRDTWKDDAKRLADVATGYLTELIQLRTQLAAAQKDTERLNDHAKSALNSVLAMRVKQNTKWGEQNHDPVTWSAILNEECGEFAEAALHNRFGGRAAKDVRNEAVDCAAVALQIVEWYDRAAAAAEKKEGAK